ncbi:APC family permease [Glacieibacterium megasporae]|uniref:APC family permease n=1 Tax=Glacieibacterium megasporae TaxID=2835787 RepID=UPI001C1DF12C|nr:APC family permease [Polymorphobacter megasporae]UAJ10185.1 APC family permease [Polymorphobacter megasporae]
MDTTIGVQGPGGIVPPGEVMRDRGLIRGVGLAAFTAAIVNGVVGAGVFTLPAVMALNVGPLAPLAFLVCAVAMGAVVWCTADAGRRVPTSGGIYGTVEAAFGKRAGFVTGFVGIWLSSVLSCGGIAAAFAAICGTAVPALTSGFPRAALICGVMAVLALVNLRGVGFAARFITVTTLVKLVPLALFVGVGVWFIDPVKLHAGVAASGDGLGGGFGRAVIFALFAFSGMETPLSASGEVADPRRNVPRAIVLAMSFVLLLYVAVQVVAQGLLGAALAHSATPLASAIATVRPELGIVLLAGAGASMLIWIGSDLLGAPRVLFAFARDKLLPAFLGTVGAKSHVPVMAIVVHTVLVCILAVSGTFEALAILSGLASTFLYSMACSAAWRLDARGVGGSGGRRGVIPVAAAIGVLAMVTIAVQAKPVELFGLAAAVAIALGLYSGRRMFAGS